MKDNEIVKVTISMTAEERRIIKQMALEQDTNVSALIKKWVYEKKEEKLNNSN